MSKEGSRSLYRIWVERPDGKSYAIDVTKYRYHRNGAVIEIDYTDTNGEGGLMKVNFDNISVLDIGKIHLSGNDRGYERNSLLPT